LQGEQGIQGPAGQDGADGENGTDGADGQDGSNGQNGADGEDGNANVIASDWVSVEFPTTATPSATFNITDDRITQDIADSAAIYAYGRSGNATISIPFTFRNRTYYFVLSPDTNEFRLIALSVDGSPEFLNDFSEVRYVIIPATTTGKGTTTSTLEQMQKAGVDPTDYYAVCNYLGLEY